ncbi:MAG: hypothetical protein MJ252_01850 [archaeon]|nr:hypothetical protein [archaeon]
MNESLDNKNSTIGVNLLDPPVYEIGKSADTSMSKQTYTLKVKSPKKSSNMLLKNFELNLQTKQTPHNNIIQIEDAKPKRYDRRGEEISTKNKSKVKVTFNDTELNKPLAQIIEIQSYKQYNVMGDYVPPESEIYGKTTTCCSCLVY